MHAYQNIYAHNYFSLSHTYDITAITVCYGDLRDSWMDNEDEMMYTPIQLTPSVDKHSSNH